MQISKPTKKEKELNEFISGKKEESKNIVEDVQFLNIKLDKEFHKAFKIYCLTHDCTMQEKIRDILLEWSKEIKNFGNI